MPAPRWALPLTRLVGVPGTPQTVTSGSDFGAGAVGRRDTAGCGAGTQPPGWDKNGRPARTRTAARLWQKTAVRLGQDWGGHGAEIRGEPVAGAAGGLAGVLYDPAGFDHRQHRDPQHDHEAARVPRRRAVG